MENLVNKKVKIIQTSVPAMVGKTVIVLYDEGYNNIIVGFPKSSNLGWAHSDFPEYSCWWMDRDNLEIMSPVTKSKFK